ncbi:MAG: SpoVR family protein [Desulfobacterium sp.]|nr:SpoVR family protein [Desulfobacteraceae bacterium]MBA3037150.1 SpoVR family protein [Desulfobacterium sp.]
MELIDQHTKKIMEGCKERARDEGLSFEDESLEYIVTNKDLLELTPKVMIPTLYDFWVHDVEVLKEKGKYELYPSNPYETVINTRPAISFYNDNNPDWLNVMIFYHVIAHIDFFQNNIFFENTWDDDFNAQALSDKRCIAGLRAEKGRWVDYVLEFARGIDNLVGYHETLSLCNRPSTTPHETKLNFYFDVFLQTHKGFKTNEYIHEIERYNASIRTYGELGENIFFADTHKKYPEFESVFSKRSKAKPLEKADLLAFILEHSDFLKKEENQWMKSVLEIVRKTSIFFQPQIRTKIMNEGWASYWHETLFLKDDRIKGHEVDFARVNAGVTAMPRVGFNPYALGMRLFYNLEEKAERGKLAFEFDLVQDEKTRRDFDHKTGEGRAFIFNVRENYSDSMFINSFIDQDFMNRYKLFVTGKRLNSSKTVWEYFVQSRKAEDYRKMITESLYHPPKIEIETESLKGGLLHLKHHFEGKPLKDDFIPNTLLGIEFLWGKPVQLETMELVFTSPAEEIDPTFSYFSRPVEEKAKPKKEWQKVLYTMEKKKISKKTL